jgi:hypothetical protein
MTELNPEKRSQKMLKTFRQWIGLFIVISGALILLLESFSVLPT